MPDALPPRTGLLKYTGTPEEQQAATEMYLQGLQGNVLGAISNITTPNFTTPEGRTDWGNWRNYVPGLPSLLYSMGSGMVEMAGNAALRNPVQYDTESGTQLVDDTTHAQMRADAPQFTVPGHEAATALNEEAIKQTLKVIPHVAPTSESGKVGQDIGIGMGQGLTAVLPEFAGPKLLTAPLKIVAPPVKAGPLGAAIGGVTGALTPPEGTPDMPEVMHIDENGDVQSGPKPGATPKVPVAEAPLPAVTPPAAVADATPSKPWSFSLISSAEAATPPAAPKVPKDIEVVQMPEQAPAPVAALPPVRPGGSGYFTLPDWKDISFLQAGGALLGGAALMWGAAKYGGKGLNTIADGIAGRTRSVVEAEQALRNPVPKTGTRVEMPLPGDAGGLSTRLAATNLDANAVVNKISKAPEINPRWQDADAQVATNDLINNPGNANRRIEHLFRTGQEEGTGHQFPKIVDYKIKSNNLTAGQQESADAYAWMKSELNLRDQNIQDAAGKGIYWTRDNDKQFRVSFDQMDTETMRRSVETLERDPAILDWYKQHQAIPDSVVDWYEKYGLITKQQAEHARTAYGDFMPTIDANGKYMRSWDDKIRTPGSGYTQPPARAWDAMIKHFGTSIQEGQRLIWQRDWLLELERRQKANPSLGQMVTRKERAIGGPEQYLSPIKPQTGTEAAVNRNITVPVAGVPTTFEINSTPLWHGLGGGPQLAAMQSGIARGIRNVFTSTTTGPLSTFTGGPFAAITAIRDTALLPTQLPRNLWRGEAERALGRRLPWGYDPTFPISVGKAGAADATSAIMKHVTDMFSDRSNYMFKDIRFALEKLLGPQKVEALAGWMRGHVAGSEIARGNQFGLGTSGNRRALNINPRLSDIGGSFRDPTANTIAPMLSRPNFKLIPDRVPLPNWIRAGINNEARGAVESFINLRSLAHELYEVLASAPHSAAYRLNRGNPDYTPRALANAIHNVTGNPGTRGTGVWAQRLGANFPFYNSNVQGAAAALRAFKENPVALGARVAYVLTLAALAQQLSALLSGKEHVDDLENKVPNTTQTSNVIIYHGPGTDPNNHTVLPMVNEWMGIWPYFSGLAGHMVGTWTAHKDPDTLARIIHAVAGAFDSHITTDDVLRTGIGTVRAAVPVQTPPGVNAVVSALTGEQVRDVPEQIVRNAIQGDPLWSGFTSGGGPKHQVPGQEGSNGVLLRADSGTLTSMMTTLGAAFGTAWDLTHNYQNRAKVGDEWAYEGLVRDWKQSMYDKTKYFNGVWQKNLEESTFGPLEERTARMWSHTAATANVNSDIRAEGFSGMKNAVPLVKVGESPLPKDPQMQDLYFTVAKYGKYISARMMPEENQIRAQIQNLKETPFMPEEKRRIKNKLADQLYQVVTKKHEMLMQMNAELSERLGGRHFDIGSNINWQGTVEQFHY